jgi:hypothetical protein
MWKVFVERLCFYRRSQMPSHRFVPGWRAAKPGPRGSRWVNAGEYAADFHRRRDQTTFSIWASDYSLLLPVYLPSTTMLVPTDTRTAGELSPEDLEEFKRLCECDLNRLNWADCSQAARTSTRHWFPRHTRSSRTFPYTLPRMSGRSLYPLKRIASG